MNNKFLQDFMKLRQQIATKPSRDSKKETSRPSIGGLDVPKSAGLTLAYIITKEPPRKEVIEYLRERVEQILEEE
jgi:hypothetical protein